MTKARIIANLGTGFVNISDTGTEGTKVASGTTAQRGSTTGQWRFNSTTGLFEGYNGSVFKSLDVAPTVTAVSSTNIFEHQINSNFDLTITGTNFQSGATVKFLGNDGTPYASPTVTINSDTQIVARVPTTVTNANEPFDVQVANTTGLSGTKEDAFNINASPAWQTASGSVGQVVEGESANIALSATDPEGDAVTYAETTSNLSGAGYSISSSGVITGTANAVSNDTTTSFTARATSSSSNIADRNFSIITKNITTQALLFDATNLSSNASGIPTANGQGLGSVSPSTAVTFSNVNGSSGTLAHGNFVANKADTYGHYTHNDGRDNNIGDTFWSISTNDPHAATNSTGAWFGTHNGGSYGNGDVWFTMDYGANPSFRITRMTGEATWRTGTGNFVLYGTNDISNVTGNNGSSDAGALNTTGLTQIFNVSNPGATWDSSYQTSDFYRYYVFRIYVNTGASYDWGWDMSKWYGDYY